MTQPAPIATAFGAAIIGQFTEASNDRIRITDKALVLDDATSLLNDAIRANGSRGGHTIELPKGVLRAAYVDTFLEDDFFEKRSKRTDGTVVNNITLVGHGPLVSIVKLIGSKGIRLNGSGYRISDLGFDFAGQTKFPSALYLRYKASDVEVTNCQAFDTVSPRYGFDDNVDDRHFISIGGEKQPASGIRIRGCVARNGIQATAGAARCGSNVHISDCAAYYPRSNGFAVVPSGSVTLADPSRPLVIENVLIERCYVQGIAHGSGFFLGNDSPTKGSGILLRNYTVRHCQVKGVRRPVKGSTWGIFARLGEYGMEDVVLEDNEIDLAREGSAERYSGSTIGIGSVGHTGETHNLTARHGAGSEPEARFTGVRIERNTIRGAEIGMQLRRMDGLSVLGNHVTAVRPIEAFECDGVVRGNHLGGEAGAYEAARGLTLTDSAAEVTANVFRNYQTGKNRGAVVVRSSKGKVTDVTGVGNDYGAFTPEAAVLLIGTASGGAPEGEVRRKNVR